ncbi:hypothetical protein BS50DRAFT_222803 [Corynespora cassiicola Philippines]|uniref:Uncharacterized protein n=1 Tax=Corynespora cassiicola Philippines TaxID=1448308 RepID=A0A2T2N2M6_CORCC|nr:hypothetical protein BS50DRAFT_222803 [Corynespora cassiicola Philippines]
MGRQCSAGRRRQTQAWVWRTDMATGDGRRARRATGGQQAAAVCTACRNRATGGQGLSHGAGGRFVLGVWEGRGEGRWEGRAAVDSPRCRRHNQAARAKSGKAGARGNGRRDRGRGRGCAGGLLLGEGSRLSRRAVVATAVEVAAVVVVVVERRVERDGGGGGGVRSVGMGGGRRSVPHVCLSLRARPADTRVVRPGSLAARLAVNCRRRCDGGCRRRGQSEGRWWWWCCWQWPWPWC